MKSVEHLIVNIPKDIDAYEKKAILGMTARQFLWVCISIIVSVLIIVPFVLIGADSVGYLLGFAGAVLTFSIGGFSTWHGRPYSEFVKAIFRYYRTEQRLIFNESVFDVDKEDGFSERKKTKQDKKINKGISEAGL